MTTPEVKRKVKRLDELAQSVPPPRDLWPAISQAIEAHEREATQAGSQTPGAVKRRPAWWMPAMSSRRRTSASTARPSF